MSPAKKEIGPLVALGIILLFCGIGLGIVWQPFARDGRFAAMKSACYSNLKQLSTGFLMYSVDYDDTAMPAENWHSALEPYTKNTTLFHCRKAQHDSDQSAFGYAYNVTLSKSKLPAEGKRGKTVLFFDSTVLTPNATGGKEIVARPGRHAGTNNFAFLDNTVKGIKDGTDPGPWNVTPTR